MKLLALDQASRTSGWSVFENEQLIASGTFTVADDKTGKRLVKIRNKIISLIEEYEIDEAAFEDIQLQSAGSNVHTHKILAEVFGIVEELLAEKAVHYQIVPSTVWRGGLGFKGDKTRTAQKKKAQEYVFNNFNKKVSEDEADAICIGAYITKQNNSFFDWS